MNLHVGCAMWNLKSWQGRFLPQSPDRLRFYAGWCNAVEGNTTFYATPARETVSGWAAQTPSEFRFVLKLPKTVTHERRLGDAAEPLRAFFDAIEPLGPRVHALWVQLPGSFGPGDLTVLSRFLRSMPTSFRYAVEVRDPAFFSSPQRLEEVLAESGSEWIPFDTTTFFATPPTSDEERDAWMKKPRMPLRTRALTDRPIIRYLGRDDTARTVEGWQRWVEVVAGWLREGRSPTVFVHTPDNADAPELCRRFHDEVRELVPSLAPLPSPAPLPESGPLTLF
ncbi:DUF72 domain-containing protein [Actinoplanes sp. NPDC051861]|uniref:DUF72 domain-containing protein n=1 Tax=Actinoplanes sp. NPDC051861 TaxID=3155170 RepID=UPI003424CEE9